MSATLALAALGNSLSSSAAKDFGKKELGQALIWGLYPFLLCRSFREELDWFAFLSAASSLN